MDGLNLIEELMEPLGQCLDAESARRLLDLRTSEAVQARMSTLAEKANEDLLTPAEKTEYEAILNAVDFIAILQLKARQRLRTSTA